MNLSNLETILADQPKYRLEQIKRSVFVELIESWDEATSLPKDIRQKLTEECPLDIESQIFESRDGKTTKAGITLLDGQKIETVLMRHRDGRNTVCVSSQIGCPLACSFCATGKMGFKRNLHKFEILEQVLLWARILKKENERVSNIVYMGMGEPFLNYDEVMGSIKMLNDAKLFNIGARNISVSTVGIPESIRRFAKEGLQVNLAVSLHAPIDSLRSEIMPANKKWTINKVLQAVDEYIELTNRQVMFEYTLLEGINDAKETAEKLADIMKKKLYVVNLIQYHDTGSYRGSSRQTTERFEKILENRGVKVTRRYSFGDDVHAACGQLISKLE